jgi:hypothetical protein
MAFTALATTLGSAAYLISTREQPPTVPDEVDAAESATDEAAVEASEGDA